MAAATDDRSFCPPPRDTAGEVAPSFEGDSFDWAALERFVQSGNYLSANSAFYNLRSAVLSASLEDIDAMSSHAQTVWEFLLGFAAEKNQYRSGIVQVVKKLMEVTHWSTVFKTTPKLHKGARMLHEDLQMALGLKTEVCKKVLSVNSVLDREHCCTCNSCAKPWAFSCKFNMPHYCMKHYREAQLANPVCQDQMTGWAECAPAGFDSEPMAQDSHVRVRNSLPPQTRKLVAKATSKGGFTKEMSRYGLNLAPDKVNRATVDKASEVVQQLRQAIKEERQEDAQKLSMELRQLIPQDHSEKDGVDDIVQQVFSDEELTRQVEILEMLDSIADSNELKSHDALSKYCDISFLEPESEEGRLVRSMLVQNLGSDVDISAMETFRVSRHDEENREEEWAHIHPSNNRLLLWHGSQTSRFVSILRNGLVVKEMTNQQWLKAPGGTFDHGIYFTDIVSKSLQYSGGSDDELLLILAEVCLGTMYACKGRFGVCFDWNARSNAQRLGCNSTWGVGKLWPDPNSAIISTPDSIIPGCDVPMGEPVGVRCSDGTQPVLDYNEFIVYNSNQVRLRYLVRLRYSNLKRRNINEAQRSTPMGPKILMPAIRESILDTPYCRFAKEAASMKLESSVRWQYFFDKKQTFDSTLPGWHSYGQTEARLLEKEYEKGSSSAKIRSGGYDYNVDLQRMRQTNLSTQTTRPVRRRQVSFRKIDIPGGGKWELVLDLAKGESVEWLYEMAETDQKIDFRVEFFPAERREEEPVSFTIVNKTRSASAWSYTARCAGSVQLKWSNFFKFAYSRVVLVDWHVEPPAAPAASFGGPPAASNGIASLNAEKASGSLDNEAASGSSDVSPASNSQDAAAACASQNATAASSSQDARSELDDAEQMARIAKLETRQASQSIIRHHLQQHLERNPDASYTSWIAALHPENVKVDPRLTNDSAENEWMNVWREVWREAKEEA